MIAREEAVDAPADRELERAEQRLRHRPRAGALRRLDDTECPSVPAHAATGLPSSSGGAATASSTRVEHVVGRALLGERAVA